VCLSYREECLGNIKGDLLGYRIYYIRQLCHRRLDVRYATFTQSESCREGRGV
jgi:hypothetical protein